MIGGSGALVAIAWVINSMADSLFLLYLGAAIGGIGAGVIYGGSVGNALKWFPDRRGLAAGLTAAGFGAGSALTVIPIANMIARERLSGRLPVVRPRPGHHRDHRCDAAARAGSRRSAGAGCAGGAADRAATMCRQEVLKTPLF